MGNSAAARPPKLRGKRTCCSYGAGKTAQWALCFLNQQKDLSLDPQDPYKKLGTRAYDDQSSDEGVDTGGPPGLLASQCSQLLTLKYFVPNKPTNKSKEALKNIQNRTLLSRSTCIGICICTCMWTHTNAQKCSLKLLFSHAS